MPLCLDYYVSIMAMVQLFIIDLFTLQDHLIYHNGQNRVRQKYLSLSQKSGNLVSIAYDFKQESIQNISGVQNIRSFCQSLGSMSDEFLSDKDIANMHYSHC